MNFQEPKVRLSSVKQPVIVRRPFSITSGRAKEVTRIESMELIVLVNGCLYIVMHSGQGLRAGEILSRNLDLTKRKGHNPKQPAEQVFVRYKSIYDALRGIGRVDDQYKAIEIPKISGWRGGADQLLRFSWVLTADNPEKDAQFVWMAEVQKDRLRSDRAEKKVAARTQFGLMADLKDRLGRRNTQRIPLRCLAAERSLQERTQDVRGIGRRMDWRAVVLEHIIDELQSECRGIRRAAQEAFTAADISGDKPTPRSLRERADRMGEYALFLREVHARPFDRVFAHVANELDQTCDLLHEAAHHKDKRPLTSVRNLLSRIYRSMMLVDVHTRLEEILTVVSRHHQLKQPLSPGQVVVFDQELADIDRVLTTADVLTGVRLNETFSTDVLPAVYEGVHAARADLKEAPHVHLPSLRHHLKSACKPL